MTPATLWDVFADEGQVPPPVVVPCPTCGGCGTVTSTLPTHRAGDRDTSQAAGSRQGDSARFSAKSRQAAALGALYYRPDTAFGVARRVLGDKAPIARLEGMRRRVSTLAQLGLVVDSGDRQQNDGSSTPAIVWRLTGAGVRVYENLQASGWSDGVTRPR